MSLLFECSFCDQKIKLASQQVGKAVRCPNCNEVVWLYPNLAQCITNHLMSEWFYMRDRLLRKPEETGPVSDTTIVSMIEEGEIAPESLVRSEQFTEDNWIPARAVRLSAIKSQIKQRNAETDRQLRLKEREDRNRRLNREKLVRAVQQAVSDGRISLKEREHIFNFSENVGIPVEEVERLFSSEADKIIKQLVEESLEDGLLEPSEKERISSFALGLGVQLQFSPEDLAKLQLAEFAWELANHGYMSANDLECSVSLNKNEDLLATTEAEWAEVANSKRPSGIPLGNDFYLKPILSGRVVLTNKRIIVVGELATKKMTLSSIEAISWYQDGVFFNRSTGKSVLLAGDIGDPEWNKFAILVQYVKTGQPVLGLLPTDTFVPSNLDVLSSDAPPFLHHDASTHYPRYTFRVVGDFVGDREYWGRRLNVGDPVALVREPQNEYDRNAVKVYDSAGHELGYIKRDVASWFAPMLDTGQRFKALVRGRSANGNLLLEVSQ